MTALILALSCATAFAAKGDFTVNGANAKVGDKITYTLNLSDCTEKIEGLQMYVAYDSKYLKIDPESLDFPTPSSRTQSLLTGPTCRKPLISARRASSSLLILR